MAPKYKDIVNKLELELSKMRSEGRSKLPSEQELCILFGCSRQTIRSALEVLEGKGLIVKRRGSGTYLADAVDPARNEVLLIVEDEDRYIYPAWIKKLRSSLEGHDLKLTVQSTRGSYMTEGSILSSALEGSYAAVVIDPVADMVPDPNLPVIDELREAGVPVILTTDIREDNEEGSEMLVRHLVEHGHREIGGIFRVDDSRGLSRYRGCIRACRDLGLTFDDDGYYLYSSAEQKDIGYLKRFIAECLPGRSAVICQNDIVAYQLIQLLIQNGINVPSDVAVVSFDNSYYTTLGDIGITSLGHTVNSAISDAVVSAVSGRSSVSKRSPQVTWKLHVRNSG